MGRLNLGKQMKRSIEYVVQKTALPLDVGSFLRKEAKLTSNQISRLKFRENGICVNENPARVNQKLKEGDRIRICLERDTEGSVHLEAMTGNVSICYEDEDLCIVNKESGVAVHPSHGHYNDTLANYLVAYYRERGQEIIVRPIGRLDKDTSGLVLFAKNQVAAARLTEANKTAVRKEYLALVKGCPNWKEKCINTPIKAAEGYLNRMVTGAGGKCAVTHCEVKKLYDGYSLVRLYLETGRTHQIRVHMASVGYPLLGDEIYGEAGEPGRAALHCWRMILKQPFTGEEIEVTVPLPADMERIINNGTIKL